MPEFLVINVSPERGLVAVVDRFRQYHVGVSASALPQLHARLGGPLPSFRLSLLSEHQTGRLYAVNFVAIRCGQAMALELLQDAQGAASLPALKPPLLAARIFEAIRPADLGEIRGDTR
ncbi:MAG: hypothetical protein HY269_05120 [Deltaproteobacteria bacterium]|nr:hypothetical protein [Deltaproteobacteria bacterium]